MSAASGPDIIEDGLVLCLDAGNRGSYSGSGTVWRDLAGSNNGTLTNGPIFNSANGGSIVFDENLNAQLSEAGLATVQPNISIGYWQNGARYLNGNVSQVSIYNRVLTPAEILQNYNATKSRFLL